jgi:hypothetical protein
MALATAGANTAIGRPLRPPGRATLGIVSTVIAGVPRIRGAAELPPTGMPWRKLTRGPVTSASAFGRVLTEVDLQIDPVTRQMRTGQPAVATH